MHESLAPNDSWPQLTPPAKRRLADEIADRLRDAILHGAFKPGAPLREEELASTLDVSRGPVREALVQLEHEGLVLVRRNRGATVARLSQNDVEEVYSLRLALERLAVQRAAGRSSEEDFAAMEAVLADFVRAMSGSPSEKEIADLDIRFHDVIFRAAQHQRLYECWTNLRSQVYMFLLSRNVVKDLRRINLKGHEEILSVLRVRDGKRAMRVIEAHLRGAYDHLVATQVWS